MILKLESGQVFAQGSCSFSDNLYNTDGETPRIFINIKIQDSQIPVVLDTGGFYLILHPQYEDVIDFENFTKVELENQYGFGAKYSKEICTSSL